MNKTCDEYPKRTRPASPARLLMSVLLGIILSWGAAWAEVSIETSVDRSVVPIGEQIELDVIVTNADGRISQPVIGSVDGFTSYSQGHSQEISIVNGQSTSRSIFSYVLIANSVGPKKIGPFRLTIGGKPYEVAPVDVEVTAAAPPPVGPYAAGPVTAPSPRALPQGNLTPDDIFVRPWLDKDEVYVNEPVVLTYTLFTRLSATYKGFEKEPVTTGFWVEDFPPEKTVKRTEQILRGMRYVVADVRKITLFPTQAGVFTIDPGVLSAAVEVRGQDPFDTFFSSGVFGARRGFSSIVSQVIQKSLPAEPVTLTVKALPEAGRPASFTGAVGRFDIDSSLDKTSVEAGTPVTYRLTIRGEGNIETLQLPAFPKLDDFKIYDSSFSSQLSKSRLVVEGEKSAETVVVPRKPGDYVIPPLKFSYFDPRSGTYTELETPKENLKVLPGTDVEPDQTPSTPALSAEAGEPRDVSVLSQDVRFIRLTDDGKPVPPRSLHREGWFIPALAGLVIAWLLSGAAGRVRRMIRHDEKSFRARGSHAAARKKLKAAEKLLKQGQAEAFFAEVSRAVTGYFADRLGVAPQTLSVDRIEELMGDALGPQTVNELRRLTTEVAAGRYGRAQKAKEDLETVYELAERVLSAAEKVKLK